MSTPEGLRCAKCGAELAAFATEGFCSACLLEQGLASETPTAALPPLSRFGDYELIEEIARGGMGVVYKARQVSLGRLVAVKMILSGQFASAAEMQRFRVEARATAALQHPGIVAIHEVGEHDGLLFFSMEFVEGRNLAQLSGPWPARRAAQCVRDVAETIHYAHQHGVLHRDLKPSNVLIDVEGKPRVTDFGLAKRLADTKGGAQPPELTVSGQLLGSPNFMPPEQAAGKHRELTPASDVYSLGALLYHMLTGRPPFLADNIPSTLRLVAETEPVAPRLLVPNVPPDLETICLKCLEKDPPRRYAAARALARELDRFLCDEPIHARPANRMQKVWRWCQRKSLIASLTASIVLIAVIALAGWMRATEKTIAALKAQQKALDILYASDLFLVDRALKQPDPGETDEILQGLQAAINRHPGNAVLWNARALMLERKGAFERSYQHFSRAIELASTNRSVLTYALLGRRDLLRRMNRVGEARADDFAAKELPSNLSNKFLPNYESASHVTISLGLTNRESGLYAAIGKDSRCRPAFVDDGEAWFFEAGWNYGYFFIDPTFKWSLGSKAMVRIEYRNQDRKGQFEIHYDGREGRYTVARQAASSRTPDAWQVADFPLSDVRFENSQNAGADFRICNSSSQFYVRRVTVLRGEGATWPFTPLEVPPVHSGPESQRMQFTGLPIPKHVISGTNGTLLNGATIDKDVVGTVTKFHGLDDVLVMPGFGSKLPSSEITIEFWQKAKAANNQSSVSLEPYDATHMCSCIAPYSDGRVYFDFGNNHAGGQLRYDPSISIIGTWQHFAFVASESGNFMQIYRNGVLEAQKTGMTPFENVNCDLRLGAGFVGLIGDVRIYDRALSITEILSIHKIVATAGSNR